MRGITLLLLVGAAAKPAIPNQDASTSIQQSTDLDTCSTTSTSRQWLIICGTSIFWPTSTDYFYGPTTGPKASAVSCNAAWVQFDERARGLESLGATSTSTSFPSYITSTGACNTNIRGEGLHDTHTGPVTTLCDGVPRALGPRESITEFWPGTGPCSSFMVTETSTTLVYRSPSPTPKCKLNTRDCIPVWQTYNSLQQAYYSSITTEIPGDTKSPIRPGRCPSTKRTTTTADACNNCHYLPDTATLFYWPVSTVSGDLCLQNGSTVPATPTADGPNTAVVNGNTFVSPTVYVSFTSIYARGNSRSHPNGACGDDHKDVIISVDPGSVTSYRHHTNARYPRIGTAYPFNFAEFQPHPVGNYTMSLIPWEQYLGGSQCVLGGGGCTMIRDDYLPWMEIPDVMTQIDPRWTSCHRSWYLPPVSLVPLVGGLEPQQTGVAKATQKTQAAPMSGLTAPTPKPTH
ncbi:conserved hypothetical protein [Aspergillus terreus NIH2624]|uniref:Uncharacterized protein n=1 Tax=Aspergillus terreus (strain NIH 2624 / FGSC A1156) TaxID=341663 RepID=Q0C8T7_ASPTN|nr:uncharacterized protein ATEG_09897 [Aspergillus terreus NIH2624]EAU30088.1 conserved hypothetical protein [Aspergillus terreus NIH2624]